MNSFAKRHEPRTLQDFIFEDPDTRDRLQEFATNLRDGNIILYGTFGTGKSKLAKTIIEARVPKSSTRLDEYEVSVHAQHFIGATFQDKFFPKWNIQSVSAHKPYCVLEEVDQLNATLQHSLRGFIDEYSHVGCLIMTTNNLHAVDGGIRSRSECFEIPLAKPALWLSRARTILNTEGVTVSDDKLKALLTETEGSIREILRTLETTCLRKKAMQKASQVA